MQLPVFFFSILLDSLLGKSHLVPSIHQCYDSCVVIRTFTFWKKFAPAPYLSSWNGFLWVEPLTLCKLERILVTSSLVKNVETDYVLRRWQFKSSCICNIFKWKVAWLSGSCVWIAWQAKVQSLPVAILNYPICLVLVQVPKTDSNVIL